MADDRPAPVRSPAPAAGPAVAADERLAALVRDYGRLIRHVIRKVGGAEVSAEADDIEQAVLVSLWQQVAREQNIDHPSSYVYRAAVRETVRALKREHARAARHAAGPVEVESMPAPDDPARAMEAREQREALAGCLRALAPERGLAVRAHLAGFSVDEIMGLFGWPYQRARNLVARGMADLRAGLRQRGMA
jgi:RNA polymerase sigma factor (sigma-70 family)